MPIDFTSGNSITISNEASSLPLMKTHSRFKIDRVENRLKFETHIESDQYRVDELNVCQMDYDQAAMNGLGTISVNNGQIYSADLYFVLMNGENVLRIDVKMWSGMASFINTGGTSYESTLYSGYVVSNSSASLNVGQIDNTPAQEFVNLIRGRKDLDLFVRMLRDYAEENGIEVPIALFELSATRDLTNNIRIPLLNYLMYPMVREAKSIAIAKNAGSFDSIWRQYGQKNFKNLIAAAFGKTTSKLLKEMWKFIVVGEDHTLHEWNEALFPPSFAGFRADALPEMDVAYKRNIEFGTKHFDSVAFIMALDVYKAFGFDYLYQFLELDPSEGTFARPVYTMEFHMESRYPQLLGLAKFFDKGKVVRMFRENQSLLPDTVRMLNEIISPNFIPPSLHESMGTTYQIPKVKGIEELHDKLSRDITIVKAERNNKPIPLYPWEEKLDGIEFEGMKFIVARNTRKLAEWGAELKNCIASYDTKAVEKRCLLVGIEKDGKLLYTMELMSLIQKPNEIPFLDGNMSEEEYWDKYGNRFETNFLFWDQDSAFAKTNSYRSSLSDGRGIQQLVKLHNGSLTEQEFDSVSKVVYAWFSMIKSEVVKWLGQLPETEKPTNVQYNTLPEVVIYEGERANEVPRGDGP